MSKQIINALRLSSGGEHKGWGGPEYTNWKEEQMSWKKTCYIGDWTFLWNLIIEGPDALKMLSDTSVNSFEKFDIGKAKHVVQCNKDGKVISEGILMRLDEQKFVTQSSPAFYMRYIANQGNYNVKTYREDCFNYQVQGPNSLALLQKLTGESLTDIGFMRFKYIKVNGKDVLFLRQGMAGEIGFELQGPMDIAKEIYEAVLEIGQEFGIKRLGRRSAMINHLEACFPTASWHYLGATFDIPGYRDVLSYFDCDWVVPALGGSFEGENISDYYRSPVEMGWTKNINFNHDFIGKEALKVEVANPKRTIVTLEFNKEDVVDIFASQFSEDQEYDFMEFPLQPRWILWADKVLKDGDLIGVSTVPGFSYYFKKMISLTYIDVEFSTPGTEVIIVWGKPGSIQKHVRATVAPAPYKKDNRRLELSTIVTPK